MTRSFCLVSSQVRRESFLLPTPQRCHYPAPAMRHLPVHWSEGLFLRPHHFQAQERCWNERAGVSLAATDPCSYGLVKLEIDPTALASRQVQLRSCRARLRDGTLIWLEAGEEPDRLNLRPVAADLEKLVATVGGELEQVDTVRVFLAVPRYDPAAANVAPPGAADRSRTQIVRQSVQDETAGGNDQELEFRRLNVTLKLSTDDLSGFELLPIAQIRRAGDRESPPEIDPDYFPPVLAIDAWPPLGRDIVRSVYDMVSRKVDVLAEQAVSRQVGFSSSEPGDLDRLIMLSKLLESQAVLRTIAFAAGIHPRTAYAELCRVAGQLAIFEPGRKLEELPVYDHDDLAGIFRQVKLLLERMIGRVVSLEFEQRYFVGSGPAQLSVAYEPKWFGSDWQTYVGVLRGDLPEEECDRLLSGNAHLDWKLGSGEEVDRLFKLGLPGLELQPVDHAPRALPGSSGWLFYRIGSGSPAYQSVQQTQNLAIRVRDSSVVNADSLPGQRRLEVIFNSRRVSLEFALFAVPS
jgi:type VI secretion system protein ImpJ